MPWLRTRRGLPAGIKTVITSGGTAPESFLIGRTATAGHASAPPMSQGADGAVPNAWLTYVIDLGGIPGQRFESLYIDDEKVSLGTVPDPDYGVPVLGRFAGHAWLKYHDGSQSAADPMLLSKFGDDPDWPRTGPELAPNWPRTWLAPVGVMRS